MEKTYEPELFKFAVVCGLKDSLYDKLEEKDEEKSEELGMSMYVVHSCIAEFGLAEEYIKYTSEISGIDSAPFFKNMVEGNNKNKETITLNRIFSYVLAKSLRYEVALHQFEKDGSNVEELKFRRVQKKTLNGFIVYLGKTEEYLNYLQKYADIAKEMLGILQNKE